MNVIINNMVNLKKSILGLGALIVVFGLVFSFVAFSPTNKIETLKYRYNGPDEAGLTTLTNWTNVSEEEEPEGCTPGTEIPCLVQFNDNEYDDIVDFYTTHDTAAEMFSSTKVASRKNEN